MSYAKSEKSSITPLIAIYKHAQQTPDKLAYGTLDADGSCKTHLTYRTLVTRAEKLAHTLRQHGKPGDRVALLLHGGEDFVLSFFGCMIAGMIAVPLYPVRPATNATLAPNNLKKLAAILNDSQSAIILSTQAVVDHHHNFYGVDPLFSQLTWLAADAQEAQAQQTPAPVNPNAPAFLQYTSGSTSLPKGVMVSHTNLVSMFQDMDRSCQHNESSVMINWLPVYHDMGLIYGTL